MNKSHPLPRIMRAFDFYSKFGANTNIHTGQTLTSIQSDLAYTGLTAIRDSLFDATIYPQFFAPLAAAGVRLHLGYQGSVGVPPMTDWITGLKNYLVTPYPGSVIGVAGPNEPENQGFTYTDNTGGVGGAGIAAARQAQAALYAAMKADPALAGIPVDCWPISTGYSGDLAGYIDDVTGANEQTAVCDRANLHDYYGPDLTNQPTFPTDGPIYNSLQRYLINVRQMSNHQRFVTTETGWLTPWASGGPIYASVCDQRTQARLILCDLFDHASLTYCEAVFIFSLRGGPNFYGLIYDDGTPTLAGIAVRNLMAILKDEGRNAATFSPRQFNYALTGMPAQSGYTAIAKSDGSFWVILWNETPFWNASTGSDVPISSSSVTVNFAGIARSGSVYDPINSGTTPISTFTNQTSIGVSLNDAPLIIKAQ